MGINGLIVHEIMTKMRKTLASPMAKQVFLARPSSQGMASRVNPLDLGLGFIQIILFDQKYNTGLYPIFLPDTWLNLHLIVEFVHLHHVSDK